MKMKAFVIVALAVICIFAATLAHAQGGLKLAVDVGGVVPISNLKDIAGTGFATNVRLVYMFSEELGLAGHVGYHKFASNEIAAVVDVSCACIPIKIGLWGKSKRFYTNPSFGFYRGASDFDGTKFGMEPRVGYLFPLGDGNALDLGFEFHYVLTAPESALYFGVTLGAVFSLSGE